jgi:hypothetical protein
MQSIEFFLRCQQYNSVTTNLERQASGRRENYDLTLTVDTSIISPPTVSHHAHEGTIAAMTVFYGAFHLLEARHTAGMLETPFHPLNC